MEWLNMIKGRKCGREEGGGKDCIINLDNFWKMRLFRNSAGDLYGDQDVQGSEFSLWLENTAE